MWLEHLLFGVEEVAKALDCLFLDINRMEGMPQEAFFPHMS